ncbi:MAG: DcaP family trimeric outer membrane transporter [Marinobacter sp.]|nr:DcaP family trimeric outer membrane transporter [Marinobacter sp.]
MQNNKLRMAIRATAAFAALGMASQAYAIDIPTGDWDTSIYGYAAVNAVYDIDEDIATSTQAGDFSAITTDGSDTADGHFGADAKQSRIGIRTMTPEGVKIVIETDFRADNNRLRHAYGEYNGVLAGQTWSNFNSFAGFTPTLDFDSVSAAGLFSRTAQLRYTTGPFSVSVEEPKSSLVDSTLTEDDDAKDGLPTLTARFEDSAGSLSYSAAGLVHQVGYDTGASDDTAMGYGAFLAGKIAINDMVSIQGSVNYSDGANSYMWRSGENYYGPDAYVDPNNEVETITTYGATLGTSINLGGGQSINIVYGMATNDYDDAEADYAGSTDIQNAAETNQALFANYQFSPVKNVTMGVEYQYLKTEDVDGDDGDANRVMFMAKYGF